jgi:hypothetical protein
MIEYTKVYSQFMSLICFASLQKNKYKFFNECIANRLHSLNDTVPLTGLYKASAVLKLSVKTIFDL